jgi:error-prone DNA polymerase
MATFKFTGGISKFKDKLVNGMVARGYDKEFAERTFSQLEGFGSYGFRKAMQRASPSLRMLPPG